MTITKFLKIYTTEKHLTTEVKIYFDLEYKV